MKDLILKEIYIKMNIKEKIIVKLHKRIFIKVYKMGIEKGLNAVL